jgi:hypothetical protein
MQHTTIPDLPTSQLQLFFYLGHGIRAETELSHRDLTNLPTDIQILREVSHILGQQLARPIGVKFFSSSSFLVCVFFR